MKRLENYDQYYLSYSGVRLPLSFLNPLKSGEIENRNTFFGVQMNDDKKPTLVHKIVYGEVELTHEYTYHDNGNLKSATIFAADGEIRKLIFDDRAILIDDELIAEA